MSLDAERSENMGRPKGFASKRPVDVYLGTRSESGREVNAMRAALAEGRRI